MINFRRSASRSPRRRPGQSRNRPRTLEILEGRALLAAGGIPAITAALQNPRLHEDVNNDGLISPLDALLIINELNAHGPRQVSALTGNGAMFAAARPGSPSMPYLDVTGDNAITASDALVVFNILNDPGPSVRLRLVTKDLDDNVITSIPEGSLFVLEARVLDLRTVNPTGVFSAYLDVNYDPLLVGVNSGTTIDFQAPYANGHSGDLNTAGLIDEAGAFDGDQPLGPSERALWSVVLRADAAGVATFDAEGADNAVNDVLLYDENIDIPDDQIDYVDATLTITTGGPPSIIISDVNVVEGTGVATSATFTVTLSGPSNDEIQVNFTTVPGTALAGSDYTAASGILTFAPLQTSKTISIPLVTDSLEEPEETFFVDLSNPTAGATLNKSRGTARIQNDDGVPTLSVDDVTITEGNVGNQIATFTVTLSASNASQVTVGFATSNDTATAGQDYLAQSGVLTFTGGQSTRTITVPIIGDSLDEIDETFNVTLTGATNAIIGKAVGVGTITDNDATPVATISDIAIFEGDAGTKLMQFDVTLSAASGRTATVAFATANGTALSPSDYDAQAGTLTFLPGDVTETISIVIKGDASQEGDENFTVNLSNAIGLQVNDAQALATIIDDDGAPSLTITNPTVTETNAGTIAATFTVSLSAPSGGNVRVSYQTVAGTATSPADFQAIPPSPTTTLSFAAGESSKQIIVNVNGDTLDEADETFTVVLSQAFGATIQPGEGIGLGTIIDNDPAPTLNVSGVTVNEPDTSTVLATFTLTLSTASGQPITVDFATANGSAEAGTDFVAQGGTVTFDPGQTTKTIDVLVNGDLSDELDENFFLNLTNPVNVGLNTTQAVGNIIDNDDVPSISINPVPIAEGNTGVQTAVFIVSLSEVSGKQVTVNFATANGTAIAPEDYLQTAGILTFAPGTLTRTISVSIIGDTVDEGTETFLVNLTAPTNATIGTGQGVGTIINDDDVPELSVDNATVTEPDTGDQVLATFIVSLNQASPIVVTVGFSTQNNTATAGADYSATSGVLTFAVGEVSKQITVPVIGDLLPEGNESFFLNLSSPSSGVTINDAQGLGNIVDNDLELVDIQDAVVVEADSGVVTATFTVVLSTALDEEVTVAFTTSDGTAFSPSDYQAITGTLTFAPGVTSQTILIPIVNDNIVEGNEDFTVLLTSATGVAIGDGEATGLIVDDDADLPDKVRIRLEAVDLGGTVITSVNPGDTFELRAFVQDIRTSAGTARGVASAYLDVLYNSTIISVNAPINFSAVYGNARSGSLAADGLIDEVGAFDGVDPLGVQERLLFSVSVTAVGSGLAVFTPDPADQQEHDVTVYGEDVAVLPNQIDFVGTTVAVGSNAFSIDDVVVTEGDAGSQSVTFTVTRFLPTGGDASFDFTTSAGTATSGVDFQPTSGSLTFTGSQTTQTITVTVLGDTLDENDETFSVNLSNPVGATLSDAVGIGTIVDNDLPPIISIADAIGSEGGNVSFVVSLSTASGRPVTVNFATENAVSGNLATAGVDYTSLTGSLSFAPGVTQQTINVPALLDTLTEPSELFQLRLSLPDGAIAGDVVAVGTILDVIPSRVTGSVYVDLDNDGKKDAGEVGIGNVLITLTQAGAADRTVLTAADGSYTFLGINPGTYSIRETHPAFFADGIDTAGTPAPSGAKANDAFNGIIVSGGASATGFNFGEMGLRAEFVVAFFNRRAFMASSMLGGTQINPGTASLDLTSGDVWISFDSGFAARRTFEALFSSAQGSVTLTLYDSNLTELATSPTELNRARITVDGQAGRAYFLKVTGTNPDVDLTFTDVPLPTTTTTTTSPPGNPVGRPLMASSSPSIYQGSYEVDDDLALASTAAMPPASRQDSSTDAAIAEDDWLLELIMS